MVVVMVGRWWWGEALVWKGRGQKWSVLIEWEGLRWREGELKIKKGDGGRGG